MEDISRPLKALWRPGNCGDHAGWVQKAAQGCLSVSAGWSVWRKQRGMIWLFLLKDVQLCRSSAPLAKVSIAQKHSWLGTFLCFTSPKTLSGATGQVGGNLQDESMFSLPHLCKLKGTWHSCESIEEDRVRFRGCFPPGQPLRGHLLRSCLRHCQVWRVQPSLPTDCFPPGLPFFHQVY